MKRFIIGPAFFLIVCTMSCIVSCAHSFEYINPTYVNLALCDIDSTVAVLRGYEPKDNPDLEVPGVGVPPQEAYDNAKDTWDQFEAMCFKQDYEGAYNLYNEEEKPGDFLVYLKHSSARYKFDTDVLRPLIYEYEKADDADSLYINVLEMEYWLENYTMQLGAGNSEYIPEQFPVVASELGCLLSKVGRIDDAFGLLDDYAYAVNGLTEDPVFTNYMLTLMAADFYSAAGNVGAAKKVLEDYKAYSAEHMSSFSDTNEYEHYMSLIDKKISQIAE